MDIRPDSAVVLRDGVEEEVFPDEVAVGETIIVKPGERIPLDGIVLEGSSMEDTKALTGEAVPRKVSVGDEIISGCINLTNILKIRTTKEYADCCRSGSIYWFDRSDFPARSSVCRVDLSCIVILSLFLSMCTCYLSTA